MRPSCALISVLAVFGAFGSGEFALAQSDTDTTYAIVHVFGGGATHPAGRLVELPDGSLYGTTFDGGFYDNGMVFALRPLGGRAFRLDTVYAFNGVIGAHPFAGLIVGSDGNLYGLTTVGSSFFRVNPISGAVDVLNDDVRDAAWRVLEANDGNFYGGTCSGSTLTADKIFRLSPTGELTFLHTFELFTGIECRPFCQSNAGKCLLAELVEGTDGRLYGETVIGGRLPRPAYGTLFRIDPSDSSVEVLHRFAGSDGAWPVGGLVTGLDGALWGTAYAGGDFGKGVVFRRDPSGAVTTVHSFDGIDGEGPYGSLIAADDGFLYGTASGGGDGLGTLFRVDVNGNFERLHAFTEGEGATPVELMQATDGAFYGLAYRGGPSHEGTAFRYEGGAVEVVQPFSRGHSAPSGLVEATDAKLYGASSRGVLRRDGNGDWTAIHDFERSEGSFLQPSRLTLGSDGSLYGTLAKRGSVVGASVYRIRTDGGFTELYSFSEADGWAPSGGVLEVDGALYGTTENGGTQGQGTLFRFGNTGFETLHAFDGADGIHPDTPLVLGADGELYGTTIDGGAFGLGVVFKISPGGVFSLVHSFDGTQGRNPRGGLTRAPDGRLCGTCRLGGAFDHGTLYCVDGGGEVTVEYAFAQSDGYPSHRKLTRASDGALYGSLFDNLILLGPPIFYRWSGAGFEILYVATEADGANASSMVEASDGALYGSISVPPLGGVFRLTVPPLPNPELPE